MRNRKSEPALSRRERQIMDVVLRLGAAAVGDVLTEVPDAASYDAVRDTLNILVRKGQLRRRSEGNRHVYEPRVPPRVAGRAAARRLLHTFFAGKPGAAILTLLNEAERDLEEHELAEIRAWIDRAREQP